MYKAFSYLQCELSFFCQRSRSNFMILTIVQLAVVTLKEYPEDSDANFSLPSLMWYMYFVTFKDVYVTTSRRIVSYYLYSNCKHVNIIQGYDLDAIKIEWEIGQQFWKYLKINHKLLYICIQPRKIHLYLNKAFMSLK